MKKKIWILNHFATGMYKDMGGRHHWFARELIRRGYDVTVFSAAASRKVQEVDLGGKLYRKVVTEDGVPYCFVKTRPYKNNSGADRALNMYSFYRSVKKACVEVAKKEGAPEVILASSVHPLTLLAGAKLSRRFNARDLCEIRDLWPESLIEYGAIGRNHPVAIALRILEKYVYKRADAVIFTMENGYLYIEEQGWEHILPKEKAFYINNGVDLDDFYKNRELYKVEDEDLEDENTFKVIYTGAVSRVNRLGLLLDAAKLVKNDRVKILIWGPGDHVERLIKRTKDEHIDNVVLKGNVGKKYIPYIVSKADVNILHNDETPIARFGFSMNKIFEYMASGKPILTDFRGQRNPVVLCGGAIESESNRPEDIAEAIDRTASMPKEEMDRLADILMEEVKKFDFKVLTDKLVSIIEG